MLSILTLIVFLHYLIGFHFVITKLSKLEDEYKGIVSSFTNYKISKLSFMVHELGRDDYNYSPPHVVVEFI